MKKTWNFMIDQGGTFTDIICLRPDNKVIIEKFLSAKKNINENPIINGIKTLIKNSEEYCSYPINSIRIGTTIGTNALLERKGSKVALCVTKGFKDNFVIGNQRRNHLFSRHNKRKEKIYKTTIEIDERISKQGKIIKPLDLKSIKLELRKSYESGINSLSIVLINSFKYPKHELKIKSLAKKIGFKFISCSHDVTPTINYTSRGYTTLIDSYLNPIINKFVSNIHANIKAKEISFMQSNGFLCKKEEFTGKNSILSGPAGGVIAGVKLAKMNKIQKVIGFDMGGTSTDIWHYNKEVEKNVENKISEINIKVPTLKIDTIASGGGSVLDYQYKRLIVGPNSAGSFPGPTCYLNDGPLTLTDCNLILGRIIANQFPKTFGKYGKLGISKKASLIKFKKHLKQNKKDFSKHTSVYDLAYSYINVAVENMSNAIKKASIQRGYDIRDYNLLSFGSASGQFACKVAENLGVKNIIFHPFLGLLSAYGVGCSKKGKSYQLSIEKPFNLKNLSLSKLSIKKLIKKKFKVEKVDFFIHLKYNGSNTIIQINENNKNILDCKKEFFSKHKKMFGFNYNDRVVILDSIEIEATSKSDDILNYKNIKNKIKKSSLKKNYVNYFQDGKWIKINTIKSDDFVDNNIFKGPVLFTDYNTTFIIEKGWTIELLKTNTYKVSKNVKFQIQKKFKNFRKNSPELLEIFNKLFFSVAEQMGVVLKNTAQSINVKERLDFSCAFFDKEGGLIANAPHIPIHLGAMSETVKFLIEKNRDEFKMGMALLHNDPYSGGTHLPDLTVVMPFLNKKGKPIFYFANRAHHSDIGGITPGSMPAFSRHINEEGIMFKGFPVLRKGKVLEKEIIDQLNKTKFPSRDAEQNLYDIKAQIAACQKGIIELERIIKKYGIQLVNKYVTYMQENCKNIIKDVIKKIPSTKFEMKMDNDALISIKTFYDKSKKVFFFDFSGSSKELKNNFNAPKAVTKSVIIYYLRTLIDQDIPLNEGCLKNIKIIIENNSMLNPKFPAPVVAGNVETSQTIIDALNAATGIQAACYGTMSNLTFGDKSFGYYETICGGEGASFNNSGCDAVHCHMTNTSITDAEILEWFYPVRLIAFKIRKNSGGLGKWKGGNGTVREIEFLKNLELTILSNRRKTQPFGIEGGKNGKPGINTLINKNRKIKKLDYSCRLKVQKGDVLKIKTPGGGGYGKV